MSFKSSKNAGDIAEQLVLEHLRQKKRVVNCGLNEDKSKRYEYDVWAETADYIMTFEVKHDLYANRSGNIAIEFFNSKKSAPSGITATKADYWVHVLTDENGSVGYIVEVPNLKKFLDTVKPHRTITGGGDSNADLFLYKKEDILPIFSLLSEFGDFE